MKKSNFLVRIISLMILSFLISGNSQLYAGDNDLRTGKSNDYQNAIFNERKYLFYKPDQSGIPLLIVLHGGLGNPDSISRLLDMRQAAESNGFAVAYLSGTRTRFFPNRLTWNAGKGCCGNAAKLNIDDVSYIESFIREMIQTKGIDSRRVFIAGHSNGSMMAYRVMCERGGVAGVFAISGPLMVDDCPNGKGVEVQHIHGQEDNNVPVEGGYGSKSLVKVFFNSVSNTEQTLKNAGANVSVRIIPGADHDLPSIMKDLNLRDAIVRFMKLSVR